MLKEACFNLYILLVYNAHGWVKLAPTYTFSSKCEATYTFFSKSRLLLKNIALQGGVTYTISLKSCSLLKYHLLLP